MLVANSFDLWQKDTFFSAAEEVQQSADIMESAYRRWEKENREALTSEGLDELCRELQTTLGTAKWQLEEFEKAVRLSYRHRADDFTMARHRQFVEAIESQIFHVETSLRESFSEQGKQSLRWVNLNEDECNDLASFLSGTSRNRKDESAKHRASPNSSFHQENNCSQKKGCHSSTKGISYHTRGSEDVLSSNKDAKYVIEIEAIETHGTSDDITCQADRTQGTRRTWSSQDIDAWKIVIADGDERKNGLELSIEATPKDKGSKPIFSRERSGYHPEAKGGVLSHSQFRRIRWINQILGQVPGGCQRQQQTPLHVKLSSVQFKLALMLFILLIVPFVLYST